MIRLAILAGLGLLAYELHRRGLLQKYISRVTAPKAAAPPDDPDAPLPPSRF